MRSTLAAEAGEGLYPTEENELQKASRGSREENVEKWSKDHQSSTSKYL